MDLQTRKLDIIEYLIKLKDEKIFNIIEDLIIRSKSGKDIPYRPLTKQEVIERAKKSNEDYLSGKFIEQEKLEVESNKW
jgi:hypothetical protein